MRNKTKELYGSKFELCELPLDKQEEIFENAQRDLGLIKSILKETKEAKLFSPAIKSKDYDKLIACLDFTMRGNSCLLTYYKKLQAEGKHSSIEGRFYEEKSKALN
jgi:hypothetical protein